MVGKRISFELLQKQLNRIAGPACAVMIPAPSPSAISPKAVATEAAIPEGQDG